MSNKSKSKASDRAEDEGKGSGPLPGYVPPNALRAPDGGHPPMSRKQMEAALAEGRTVYHHGRIIKTPEDLPEAHMVAATVEEKEANLRRLREQADELNEEIDRAEGDLEAAREREKEVKRAEGELAKAQAKAARAGGARGAAADEGAAGEGE